MAASLLRRGLTYFVRVTLPPDRWADIGRSMGARSGLRREVVKTLGTTDRKVASSRLDAAASAIIQEVEDALRRARLRPLADWTADWMSRALERQEELREHGQEPIGPDHVDEDGEPLGPMTADSVILDRVLEDYDVVERKRGRAVAEQFRQVAVRSDLSIAEGARRWLADERHRIKAGTIVSHEAAFRWLDAYLAENHAVPSLEAASFSDVTRRIAGDAVEERRTGKAWETVGRDYSAWNGLWRWAVRRGYTNENPWTDQTAGIKVPREHDAHRGQERGYTAAELVKLLHAGPAQLAPNGGGYAASFFDVIRLLLLTGARANEIMGLRVGDVLEEGTVVVLAAAGGKTSAASRIMPLHPFAQRVVAARLAALPDLAPGAPLWPEVPALGVDGRRSRVISSRYKPVRVRILGESGEVDLHSYRRTFLTAAETAIHEGGRLNSDLVALLVGHQRPGLAMNLYSDWVRMGRAAFRGTLSGRLRTLGEAVEDIVETGLEKAVRIALFETAEARPVPVRTTPAFVRRPRD